MAKRRRAAGNTVNVPWSTMEEGGGGGKRIPEGSYAMVVKSVVPHESDENEGLKWTFSGTEGKAKGVTFYLYTMFTPASLWKLKDLITAMGEEVPEEDEELDLEAMVGKSITGVVQDDTYQGKTTSKLVDFETDDGEEEEDDEPAPKRGAKANGKKTAAKLLSAEEVKEMDEEELEDVIKKNKLEVDLSEFKTARRKSSAVITALEEAELLAA